MNRRESASQLLPVRPKRLRAVPQVATSWLTHRSFWAEFLYICGIQLLQKVFFSKADHLPIGGYLLPLSGWFIYAFWNSRYLGSLPKPIVVLAAAHTLGAAGVLKSGDYADALGPLGTAMFSLCVMGIFAQKYHRDPYPKLLGFACFLLVPFILWQSISRNDIAFGLDGVSRRGYSLLGWFSMVWLGYTLLIPIWNKFLCVLPLSALLLTTSRSAVGAAFLIFASLYLFENGRPKPRRLLIPLAVGCLLVCVVYVKYSGEIQRILLLQQDNIERLTEVDRIQEWQTWTYALLRDPVLLGRGIMTYNNKEDVEVYQHNGFLHVLNGYGFIAGAIYCWGVLGFARALLRRRNLLSTNMRWSIGFFLAIMFHAFFECEVLGSDYIHVVSVFVAYAIGRGLWAPPHVSYRPFATGVVATRVGAAPPRTTASSNLPLAEYAG